MSLDEMKMILLHSKNDADQDTAAEDLCEVFWRDPRAQEVLVEAILTGLLDSSLKMTCLESVAQIWTNQGSINQELFAKLDGDDQKFVSGWMKMSTPRI